MLLQAKNGVVTFICELEPDAREVYLAGDFNQWQSRDKQMFKAKDGSFRVKAELAPGQYQYKFVLDGIWCNDPDAPSQQTSPSGTVNSAFVVKKTNNN